MQKETKLFFVLFLMAALILVIIGCDRETVSESPGNVEIVASEMESYILEPFDMVRNTEIEFTVEGIDEGTINLAADEEVYPEKVEFHDGKVKINNLFSSTEEEKLMVIVKTTGGEQVAELILDFDSEEKGEIDKVYTLSPEKQDEDKLLGFLLSERYSREFNHWIYFDNWYIKDFSFQQQFNLLLYLFDTRDPVFYVDEFNNRYGTWEEYKVVGPDNLEEIDGDFEEFFRKEGCEYNRGIFVYLDAENYKYHSSLGYQLYFVEDIEIDGNKNRFFVPHIRGKDLIKKFLDEELKSEFLLEKVGEKELDSDALEDIFEIRVIEDYGDKEIEYVQEYIVVLLLSKEPGGNLNQLGDLAVIDYEDPKGINDGKRFLNKPSYFYIDGEKMEKPFLEEEIYDGFFSPGEYTLRFSYGIEVEIDGEPGGVPLFPVFFDFVVFDSAFFEVTIDDCDKEVAQGDELTVYATVENKGSQGREQNLEMQMVAYDNGKKIHEDVAHKTVFLSPEEEQQIEFNFPISDDAPVGYYEVDFKLMSYDDTDEKTQTVSIVEGEQEIEPGNVRIRGEFSSSEGSIEGVGTLEENENSIPDYLLVFNPNYRDRYKKAPINEEDGTFYVDIEVDEDMPVAIIIFVNEENGDYDFFGYLSLGDDLDSIPLSYIQGDELDLGELLVDGETVLPDGEVVHIDEAKKDALHASSSLFAAVAKSPDLMDLFIKEEQGVFFGLTYFVHWENFRDKGGYWEAPPMKKEVRFHALDFHANPSLSNWEDTKIKYPDPSTPPEEPFGLRGDMCHSDGAWLIFKSVGPEGPDGPDDDIHVEGPDAPPEGTYEITGSALEFDVELPELNPQKNLLYAVPQVELIECQEKGKKIIDRLSWVFRTPGGEVVLNPENFVKDLGISFSVQLPVDGKWDDEDDLNQALIGNYEFEEGRAPYVLEVYNYPPESGSKTNLTDKAGNPIYWDDVSSISLDYYDIFGINYMVPFSHFPIRDIEIAGLGEPPINEDDMVVNLDIVGVYDSEKIELSFVAGEGDEDNGRFLLDNYGHGHWRVKAEEELPEGEYQFRVKVEDRLLGNQEEAYFEIEITDEEVIVNGY